MKNKALCLGTTSFIFSEIGARTSRGNIDKILERVVNQEDSEDGKGFFSEQNSKDIFEIVDFIQEKGFPTPNMNYLKKVAGVLHHESVLDHWNGTFFLETSRAVLQELIRHCIGTGRTVYSTRYTLRPLIVAFNEGNYEQFREEYLRNINPYIPLSSDEEGRGPANFWETMKYYKEQGVDITPDTIKDRLPEYWRTFITLTLNGRALVNLMRQRLSGSAWRPIKELTEAIVNSLPMEERSFFLDIKE